MGILIIKVGPTDKDASEPSTPRRSTVLFTSRAHDPFAYDRLPPIIKIPVTIVMVIFGLLIGATIHAISHFLIRYWYISLPTLLILAAAGWLKGKIQGE